MSCGQEWTLRQRIAHRIHRIAYRFAAAEGHTIELLDGNGEQIFNVAFEGGFVATGPADPYVMNVSCDDEEDDQ